METTLTLENIDAIIQAMDKIKHSDRSGYFNNYYAELKYRIYAEVTIKQGKECISFEVFRQNMM
jgi:uncharacterized protein YjgD (DUF1641 family)